MATMNAVDTTEEDAADLQFPKGWLTEKPNVTPSSCYTCDHVLVEPYICCAECDKVSLCLKCFSTGKELHPHANNHSYSVIRNDFQLFENSTWTAHEELKLLDAVLDSGYGNWREVSRRIQTRSKQECEDHFLTTYVNNSELPGFDVSNRYELASAPYWEYRHTDMDEPPRYSPSSGFFYNALAGYNAARSDFDMEYDNHAELPVANLDFNLFHHNEEDYDLGISLQIAIADGYRERLKERARRKRIIRDHGLILTRKTLSWLRRYDPTITRPLTERLVLFMQLISGTDFDYLMESLHHAGELRQFISRLQELRENGITHFHSCRIYQQLKRLRMKQKKEQKHITSNAAYCWRTLLDNVSAGFNIASQGEQNIITHRRSSQPLDIVGLPGYNKLSDDEKELCSVARLVPESYLEFKASLLLECKRNNGLRLAQARSLIKIDVNKTRKMYDFLMQNGYIYLPSS